VLGAIGTPALVSVVQIGSTPNMFLFRSM